jgi:branched-chain amino acid transport system substrate-binding protein
MTLHRTSGVARSAIVVTALFLTACGNQHSLQEIAAANGPDGSSASVLGSGEANGASSGSVGSSDATVSTAGSRATGGAAAPLGPSGSANKRQGIQPPGTRAGIARDATSPAAVRTGCTKQLSPITIGQVGGFTGLGSNTLAGAKVGMQVWVAATNARGGVACHPVRLVQADDQSDASKSDAAVRDLVQNKGAVAMVGSAAAISIAGFRHAVESLKVPAVGGDSLNPDWNESPMLFPQGSTFRAAVVGGVKVAADKGHRKVGIAYCIESANCTDVYQAIANGAGKVGAAVVYKSQISLTATDYTAQCQGAKAAGADQLVLAMDGSAMQRFLRSCAQLGYLPVVTTSAIAAGSVVTNDANARKATVTVGNIVFPWMRTDSPGQRAYASAMQQYAPHTRSDASTSQAWVAGEMFRFAIESLGAEGAGPITTALVLKGLYNIKHQTFGGLTTPVTFTAGQPHAPENNCYFPVTLGANGWAAPSSRPSCLT